MDLVIKMVIKRNVNCASSLLCRIRGCLTRLWLPGCMHCFMKKTGAFAIFAMTGIAVFVWRLVMIWMWCATMMSRKMRRRARTKKNTLRLKWMNCMVAKESKRTKECYQRKFKCFCKQEIYRTSCCKITMSTWRKEQIIRRYFHFANSRLFSWGNSDTYKYTTAIRSYSTEMETVINYDRFW